jgi:hypothetical protein
MADLIAQGQKPYWFSGSIQTRVITPLDGSAGATGQRAAELSVATTSWPSVARS